MIRLVALCVLVVATRAAADPAVDSHLANGRAAYERGEFAPARDELLAAYTLDPRPELLFALGQVELQLGHFTLAIDYYQRFLATGPTSEQAALAQQAIGAARARLADRPAHPAPPPSPPHREWDTVDAGLAAFGGAAMLAGAGLATFSAVLARDHTGTLSAYNARVSRAQITEWAGIGGLGAGALVVAGALVRWRLHLEGGSVQALASPTTAGVAWVRAW
jgi:tetratricopeptide (TPR) repeat protein